MKNSTAGLIANPSIKLSAKENFGKQATVITLQQSHIVTLCKINWNE
jgi:hypothetical protein